MKTNNSILFCFFGNVIFQIFVLNQFLFSNWINPLYYVIFILFIPTKKSHLFIILSSFLIGLLVDIGTGTLSSSGPIHALSSMILGYFRPKYIKFISTRGNSISELNFNNLNFSRVFFYIIIGVFFHHFLLFIFSGLNFKNILISTFLSSFFTSILLMFSYYIFKK